MQSPEPEDDVHRTSASSRHAEFWWTEPVVHCLQQRAWKAADLGMDKNSKEAEGTLSLFQ